MTIKAVSVIGVNEGYGHDNEQVNAMQVLIDAWQKQADSVFELTGIYVSAVVSESRVVYKKEWGCPEGGEVVFTVESTMNESFIKDSHAWKEAVIKVVKAVKQELKQSTVTLEFSTVDMIYLQ